MALFSQISTTGAVIGLSLLMLVSVYYIFDDYKKDLIVLSKTQKIYVVFVFFCILSTLINLKNYQGDFSNIEKMRYFIFCNNHGIRF